MKRNVFFAGIICLGTLGFEQAQPAKPDFLILGVTKCGTTSLYRYMVQHPKIIGAHKKEVHFFDNNFGRGMHWYEQKFPQKKDKTMLIGEASPGYFWKKGCARRILRHCPNTKFIVIFRDPTKRIVSEYYRRQRRRSGPPVDFDRVIKNKGLRRAYIGAGLYMDHLERWLSLFPKEQFLIVILEDLAANPKKELNKVFRFLGLEEHTLDSYNVYNKTERKPGVVRQETVENLKRFYQPHNIRLERFLGRKLPWQKVVPST